MNEEEIIKILQHYLEMEEFDNAGDFLVAIDKILYLYQKEKEKNNELQGLYTGTLQDWCKEKEKNKELEKYANWHIEHLTEDIADYIDDDRKGNASIIGEFKEEREHWKDIIRINKNEKTYIDYKNY